MAKIVRKKHVLRIERLAGLLLFTACLLSLGSSLFLGSFNNALSMKLQTFEEEIRTLEKYNEEARISIQGLSSKDRVINMATEDGMVMNQGNVVTVVDDGE